MLFLMSGVLRSASSVVLALYLALAFGQAQASGDLKASAWIPTWAQTEATNTVSSQPNLFAEASPFWFYTDKDGEIHSYLGAREDGVSDRLNRADINEIPTVTAPIGPQKAINLFGSRRSRERHVRRIVDLARPYEGIDFNYEHPALTTSRSTARRVRSALNTFYENACRALERTNRTCVITVMPRTGGDPKVWRGKLLPWVYDYELVGQVADRVRVMAYDQHAGPYGPGPVAGAPWVDKVARFSSKTMPGRKVELGIPLYGRRWAVSSRSTAREIYAGESDGRVVPKLAGSTELSSVTWKQAQAERRRCGAEAQWSGHEKAPYFRCSGEVTWFSNARASLARAQIARRHGLRGVAFWAPYGEDPATWGKLRRSGLFGRG